jgi:hypothetical protein
MARIGFVGMQNKDKGKGDSGKGDKGQDKAKGKGDSGKGDKGQDKAKGKGDSGKGDSGKGDSEKGTAKGVQRGSSSELDGIDVWVGGKLKITPYVQTFLNCAIKLQDCIPKLAYPS